MCAELRPEDWPLLAWIAAAGPKGRSCRACRPETGGQETDGRARLVAAGLAWQARRVTTAGGDGDSRTVVAGLGLIALARREGQP